MTKSVLLKESKQINYKPFGNIIRLASIPKANYENPFSLLLYRHLEGFGVQLISGSSFSYRWLRNNRGKVDIIHLHWPSQLYSRSNVFRFCGALTRYAWLLALARIWGYKIIWTAHNLFPHERNNIFLEYLARLYTVWISHAILLNFESAADYFSKFFFRRSGLYCTHHGNYIEWYPNRISKEDARRILRISDDKFVYLIFGVIRKYKGIEEAIYSFKRISTEGDVLVIVGYCSDKDYEKQLRLLYGNNPRIILITEFIKDDEVQIYFNAADIVLLPHSNVFTSGSLLLAMGFSKPVIAPSIGAITEIVDESFAVTYEPTEKGGMAKAMYKAKSLDRGRASQAAYNRAMDFSWDEIAAKTYEILQSLR